MREGSNVDKRLALLIAALLAGGVQGDDRLFDFMSQQKPLLQERTMASLWLALGPRRNGPRPAVVKRLLGPNKEPEDLLALAVRLAAARFPNSGSSLALVSTTDPGLLGSAAFANIPVARTVTLRHWRREHRHSDLFLRGALLGQARRFSRGGEALASVEQAGRFLGADSGASADVRAAALLLLARAGRLGAQVGQLSWQDLQIAASQRASSAALAARLRGAPMARDPEPGRLAAAYALWVPVSRIVSESATWATDARVRRHIAVALAARLCAAETDAPIDVVAPAFPEWSLVRWASGAPDVDLEQPEDPRLAALVTLALQGRASRRAVGAELEQTLWRWGSHPGIGPWELERGFIRDLLLVGSRGGGRYQPEVVTHLRYSPTGLDRDDTFFDIAVELFEFTGRRRNAVPDEYRLF